MDDLKCCSICTNQYDNAARKPYSISPCGHYLCFCCINRIENNKCLYINQIVMQALLLLYHY